MGPTRLLPPQDIQLRVEMARRQPARQYVSVPVGALTALVDAAREHGASDELAAAIVELKALARRYGVEL